MQRQLREDLEGERLTVTANLAAVVALVLGSFGAMCHVPSDFRLAYGAPWPTLGCVGMRREALIG